MHSVTSNTDMAITKDAIYNGNPLYFQYIKQSYFKDIIVHALRNTKWAQVYLLS